MLKKICATFLALLAVATTSAAASAATVTTTVAGTPVASLVVSNTTYVPLRDASLALADCKIGWSNGAATVSAKGL
ncbi:MAG TPA: hypothetical protein PK597_07875, partial [Oscillospiraceae bacterium]|nr:hypothetical protein [Oscillospiraceae bacterium]